MSKVTIGGIIKTSIVTAFTIATALIWKDVIMDILTLFVPAEKQFFYKLLVAFIATVIIAIIIYLILEAQQGTEVVLRKYKDKKHKEEIHRKRVEAWKKRLEREKKKRRKLRKKMKKLREKKEEGKKKAKK